MNGNAHHDDTISLGELLRDNEPDQAPKKVKSSKPAPSKQHEAQATKKSAKEPPKAADKPKPKSTTTVINANNKQASDTQKLADKQKPFHKQKSSDQQKLSDKQKPTDKQHPANKQQPSAQHPSSKQPPAGKQKLNSTAPTKVQQAKAVNPSQKTFLKTHSITAARPVVQPGGLADRVRQMLDMEPNSPTSG